MAYRIEKEQKGVEAIVVDGFEKGIADSPYQGIANIRNLDIKYYAGVSYVNYKRKSCTISGATLGIPAYATQSPTGLIYISDQSGNIFKQSAVNSSTFSVLSGNPLAAGSDGLQWWDNYLLAFASNGISICGDGTGDAGITSSNWNTSAGANGVWPINNTTLTLTASITAGDTAATISSYVDGQGNTRAFWNGPTGTYQLNLGGNSGQTVVGTFTQGESDFTFAPAAFFNAAAAAHLAIVGFQNAGLGFSHQSIVAANDGDVYFCNGSSIGTIIENDGWIFSKVNFGSFQIQASALGLPTSDSSVWITELRSLLIIMGQLRIYPWDFTSPHWDNPVPMNEPITSGINILNNIYIFAGNKGNIYLSNGTSASPFKKMPDYISGVIDPAWYIGGIMQHRQRLFFEALAVNSQSGAVVLAGIFSLGLVSGNGITSETSGSLVMESQHSFGINLVSQGSFSFTGTVSVGATSATLSTNWTLATGQYQVIFSDGETRNVTLTNSATSATWSDGLTSNVTSSITVNSYALQNGLLIDNTIGNQNFDSYYSGWSSLGSSGIDFNDTTLWSGNEAFIETDLIPIGTATMPKTFASAEFKLDQPLQSGDTISIFARQSLSDSYVQIGSTTTSATVTPQGNTISNFLQPISFQDWQWVQFKITMSCNPTATSSSFVRLREIRIR